MKRNASCAAALISALAIMGARLPTAYGQVTRRLALHAEIAAGSMIADYQRNDMGYGLVLSGNVRGAVTVIDPVAVQLGVGSWWFPAAPLDAGQLYMFSAGVRAEPRVGARTRLFFDGDVAVARTGELTRFAVDVGVGATFPIAPSLAVGPHARYVQVFADSQSDHPSDATLFSVGLIVSLRAPEPEAVLPGDRDHDGVIDPSDVCPDVPHGPRPDPLRRGCPMGDIDHDGVLDADDFCPTTPQGSHPDRRRPGCPDNDSDGDTVYDVDDVCPTVPMGLVPDPLRIGCPAPDRDSDTIADTTDACPDEPGGPSTDAARNGCPGLVSVDEREIHLLAPVYFAFRRANVLPQSIPVLEAIRDALILTPRIRRVRIEGHTDLLGIPEYNIDLSRYRAAFVERWLVEHGVAASRLESFGYGSTRPIENSRSRAASEQNRRVELHIIDPMPPAEGPPSQRRGGVPVRRHRRPATPRPRS